MSNGGDWVKTFSGYIDTYIRRPTHVGIPIPGEHHFVAIYLVPRLAKLDFLGIPFYVNPDGMKAIPGDVVYRCEPSVNDDRDGFRLGIEVKIGPAQFSSCQYNQWMNPRGGLHLQPHLLIGVSLEGLLLSRWSVFRERFLEEVYRDHSAPEHLPPGRYTPRSSLAQIGRRNQFDGLFWWSYSADDGRSAANEVEFMETLELECHRTGVTRDETIR